MFLFTLVIVFTVLWIVFGMRRTPEEKRDERAQFLGEDFAREKYYRDLANKQIDKEDKEAREKNPWNLWLAFKQGYTLPDRVEQRVLELAKKDV